MIEKIKEMAERNIGSLCLFLNNPKNIEYLNYLDNNILEDIKDYNNSEKVYYFLNDIKELLLCDCGEHRSFIGFKNGYRSTCGKKECFVSKRKQTNLEKYGVDNPLKYDDIKQKVKNTNIEKYGVSSPMKNTIVKEKFNKTMVEKYGVKWAQQSKEIKLKSLSTWAKNENKDIINENKRKVMINKSSSSKELIKKKQIKTIKDKWGTYEKFIEHRLNKIKESSMLKFNTEHHLKNETLIEQRTIKYINNITNKYISLLSENIEYIDRKPNKNKTDVVLILKCNKCNNLFEINRQYFKYRILSDVELCLCCNPILSGRSSREIELLNFIKENYKGEVISNTKNIITSELDIYLPEENIAFEFNGLYWHSELYKDKNYHLNKTNECLEKNIDLLHVWEDDWNNKQEIIKSLILNRLNLVHKISASVCVVKEIKDDSIVRDFLEKNHINAYLKSKVKIGIFIDSNLISIATFSSLKNKENTWELLRFCDILNTTIIGGLETMLQYFISKYNPKTIILQSDDSLGNTKIYKNLGFSIVYKTEPNYYWVVNEERKNKFFKKENNNYKIFDCGNTIWELRI